jgi:hypothetical protein
MKIMENRRKKLLPIAIAFIFALMMGFNVTTSVNSTNFSLTGLKVLASGQSGCGDNGCAHVCCGSQCTVNGENKNYCYGSGEYECCE